MESSVATKIVKQTTFRVLKSEQSPPELIKGLIHDTIESTTFKCNIHALDSLIQEDITDSSMKIRSLRFRQLSHPPPSSFSPALNDPSASSSSSLLTSLYANVWKLELSCPLDVRWVFHALLPALPKLSFLRFGTGCFEDFHYDYTNNEINQYYVQLLALNYANSKSGAYPEVRELNISFDERKLTDFKYSFQGLSTSINLILDFSIKYLKNSLAKTNLMLPSNCAIDSFLIAFPRIRSKGEKVENYEKNITKFVTVNTESKQSALARTNSVENEYASPGSNSRAGMNSPMTTTTGGGSISGIKRRSESHSTPTPTAEKRNNRPKPKPSTQPIIVYDVEDSDDEEEEQQKQRQRQQSLDDPRRAAKLRIVDTSKLLADPDEDDDDQVCSSTTPPVPLLHLPPRPSPMEHEFISGLITDIANEDSDDDDDSDSSSSSSSGKVMLPGDEVEPHPIILDVSRPTSTQFVGTTKTTTGGSTKRCKSPSLLPPSSGSSNSNHHRRPSFKDSYSRRSKR